MPISFIKFQEGATFMFRLLLSLLLLLVIFSGCRSTSKYSAEDVDLPIKFAAEIAILNDPNLPKNGIDKFNAACILAQNVDFTFLHSPRVMFQIFGRKDATGGSFEGQTYVIYNYHFKDKFIQFRFFTNEDTIVNAEIKRNDR
jgi:hypothetical protein